MARKGRKLRDGIKEDQERKIMTVDLISKLPDHVIHHILSFLPTIDAIRMSLLSRRWRRMWCSVPTLEFCKRNSKKKLFYNFVDQCLKQRNTNSVLTRFKLETHCAGDGDSFRVDSWLSFAAQSHLEELDLNIYGGIRYCLPQAALNLTSLTTLNLEDLKLEDCSCVNLPSLKSLSLENLLVEDQVLRNLLLGCPLLQKLLIKEEHDTFPISSIRISSSSLKFLDLSGFWYKIRVEAINLESFVYYGSYVSCNFDLSCCKKLTSLSFTLVYFCSDEDFENLISAFPLLESLTLDCCNPLDIRHEYLKFLDLEESKNQEERKYEISIDAPNLVSFNYCGRGRLLRIVMNSPNLLEINIVLDYYRYASNMEWYVNVLNFLSSFEIFKSMSILLHSEEALIFPENLRKIIRSSPLPKLKHLKVKTRCKLERESELKKALFWLSPSLETLTIEREK